MLRYEAAAAAQPQAQTAAKPPLVRRLFCPDNAEPAAGTISRCAVSPFSCESSPSHPPPRSARCARPPPRTSTIIAPVGSQTETDLAASADATLFAGAGQNTNHNGGSTAALTVCTSATATHDTTAVALLKFSLGSINPLSVLSAVLELTVTAPPAQDMPLTVSGAPLASAARRRRRVLALLRS